MQEEIEKTRVTTKAHIINSLEVEEEILAMNGIIAEIENSVLQAEIVIEETVETGLHFLIFFLYKILNMLNQYDKIKLFSICYFKINGNKTWAYFFEVLITEFRNSTAQLF